MESPEEGGVAASPGDMAALHAAKRALRAELKRRLRELSQGEKLRQSRLLAGKVMTHPRYLASRRIAVFLSMPDEVQTNEIIKDIFQKGKECFIPWYKPQSSHMDMVKLASYEEIASLPLTSWNIHQPAEDDVREDALGTADGLDLILMPGLGFDKTGNRLGRGKGYYDTFLQRCQEHPKGKPYTIALAFQEQDYTAVSFNTGSFHRFPAIELAKLDVSITGKDDKIQKEAELEIKQLAGMEKTNSQCY